MRRLLVLLLFAFPLFGKSLHWSSFDVQARLDANGDLHVVERQTMVFDGDWNGGERIFDVHGRQKVRINRITRVEDGREIELQRGNLDAVDHWDYPDVGSNTIRWRSRLPSDPSFENRPITYVIDHTFSNILKAGTTEKQFVLDHDFGMPKRDGVIERFTVRVEFDPVWNAEPLTLEEKSVAPGFHSPVVRAMTYGGEGDPPGFHRPPPKWIGFAVLAVFLAFVTLMIDRFFAVERAEGRFVPLEPAFDESLLDLSPEVAGAVWDAGIGAPEVAAVLARMTQEGKLTTRTEGDTLHLHLNVDRDELTGYERALIVKLFFDGGNDTDTDAIKSHYASSGFDPGDAIRHLLNEKLSTLTEWNVKRKRYNGWRDAAFLVAAAVLLAIMVVFGEGSGDAIVVPAAVVATVLGLIACLIGGYLSKVVADTAHAVAGPFVAIALGLIPFLAVCVFASPLDVDVLPLFACAAWCLAIVNLMLDVMRCRNTRAKISFRRRVAAARRYFIEELKKPQPNLADEWFPYVLAFGLGTNVDHWFRAFGGSSPSASIPSGWSSSSSSSSTSSSPSWTGGGGAFGGAGASGTWAAAAGVMAAGVSPPSSSGSGGSSGGGGGGSSSGGGGGGGW